MRSIVVFVFINILINCSEIGQPNSYRGTEAKTKLLIAAEIGDYAAYKALFTEQGLTGAELENRTKEEVVTATAINLTLFDLDSSKFYPKSKVSECKFSLETYGNLFKISSYVTYSAFEECDFSATGVIATKKR
ncbi:TIGR04452 family lipoprotein [Leptospira sp. id769339]|uniref:TIGR04452 family lipoprotein n=1 Tax=Leptospira sp. id769339 TaxID=2864221 RepID=UPI00214D0D2F|nr:TIGR04452 family lipoprotein [Leptospira sp. id769339]MCR1795351.1 TIGR04452 family lipoprotein [Leptospira sp. id769339]